MTTHALRADGFDASEDGTGRGTPLVPHVTERLPQSSAHSLTERIAAAGSTARMRTPAELSRGTNAEGADGFTLTTSNLGKTVNNQTPLIVHETDQL